MDIIYKKFVDHSFKYSFKCKNADFRDVLKEKEIALKEVEQ